MSRAHPINLGPYLRVTEVQPTMRIYDVRAGSRYLHGLEDGELRHHSDYHRIMIDEGTGFVSIEGGYGSFSYYWTARGGESLHAFLYDLDFDYFMGKASKKPHRVPDHDKTVAHLRRELLRHRRDKGNWLGSTWAREEVRSMWDDLTRWAAINDVENGLVPKLYEDRKWSRFLDHNDPTVMRPCGALTRFWNEHWRPFCEEVLRPHWLQHVKRRPVARNRALTLVDEAAA